MSKPIKNHPAKQEERNLPHMTPVNSNTEGYQAKKQWAGISSTEGEMTCSCESRKQ